MSNDSRLPHRARRRFGQHFLRDPSVIERIVAAIGVRPGERLVEIGPGRGALTRALLAAGAELTVVEVDRLLAADLATSLGSPALLEVIEGDALALDFHTLARGRDRLRVVGNLPYNISSPLLFHLLAHKAVIAEMCFLLQREVVNRLVALPGSRDYGRLSVMVQLLCTVEKLLEVGPEAFVPVPKVHSALAELTVRTRPLAHLEDVAGFERLVRQAFSQRRKTLRNALRELVPPVAWERTGIDPGRRPETLDVVEFARLSNEVSL